tara:strand:- start:3333 stop:3722 length:390 start_codon:yes stop_codon:yes gene_type:complete
MAEKFIVEIISPDKSIFKNETNEVTIPSYEGEMGILKDHVPLITFLRPGILKIIGETNQLFFIEDGIVEFSNNKLLILTSTAKQLSDFNIDSLNLMIEDTQKKIAKNEISDKEKYLLSFKMEVLKNITL